MVTQLSEKIDGFKSKVKGVEITESALEELVNPIDPVKTPEQPFDRPAQESLRSRLLRWQFNFYPAFRRTGGRITFISGDLKRLRLRISLNWKTRNYVGTIFGGSMYGAVDPIYMVLFIKLLGPRYLVWDKAARIAYKRPGRSALGAEFVIDDEEIRSIAEVLQKTEKIGRTYRIELRDENHTICAEIEKTLHFRKK